MKNSITEHWQHSTTSIELPDKWKRGAIFDYAPDKDLKGPITNERLVPDQIADIQATTVKGVDRWNEDGRVRTRHRVASRSTLFRPELAVDGPSVDHLEDARVAAMRIIDGGAITITDKWRAPQEQILIQSVFGQGCQFSKRKVITLGFSSLTTQRKRW